MKIGVCLPRSQQLIVVPVGQIDINGPFVAQEPLRIPAISIAPIRALRFRIYDLLILKPGGSFSLLTHGQRELPLRLHDEPRRDVVSLRHPVDSSLTMYTRDGSCLRTTLRLSPNGPLTSQCLLTLQKVLPAEEIFTLHHRFLLQWSQTAFNRSDDVSFEVLCSAVYSFLEVAPEHEPLSKADDAWRLLQQSTSASRFLDDPALRRLSIPGPPVPSNPETTTNHRPHQYHSSILTGLHHVAQECLLNTKSHETLMKLVPVICRLALTVRPEWADYWKRLVPGAIGPWPSPAKSGACCCPSNQFCTLRNFISSLLTLSSRFALYSDCPFG